MIGYHSHQDPCSMLIVQPTGDDTKGWSKDELQPMIEATPVLRAVFPDPKSRASDSTIHKKRYPGGIVHITGAHSARGFHWITVRLVLFDEVDGYPSWRLCRNAPPADRKWC
ncbi:MAG: phage terminase large subunit family protein [Methylothermaceae bacterium]|nr:phage terminase large subunit family protein [Methylothermaceae bacterium]